MGCDFFITGSSHFRIYDLAFKLKSILFVFHLLFTDSKTVEKEGGGEESPRLLDEVSDCTPLFYFLQQLQFFGQFFFFLAHCGIIIIL